MRVTCIVAAAGKGKRLDPKTPKLFMPLGGKPVLARTLQALEGCRSIDRVVAVVPPDRVGAVRRLGKKYSFKKISDVVPGGRRRFDSVKKGLAKAKDADIILVHDGARPFIEGNFVRKVLLAASKYGAAVLATPLKQTLKLAGEGLFVAGTPARRFLWEAQTPQAFKRGVIERAYGLAESGERRAYGDVTDDSMLVERLGHKVKIVRGSDRNIKITTREDLALARILVKR
jgi:2-C-methyl-D-erythritol 4-phosphate cytidylyltransferase